MMKTFIFPAVVFWAVAGGAATAEAAPNVFESSARPTPASQLDKIVFAKLSSLGIQPVLCSDAVFVRRVYLDVIGTLPTAKEAREFIQDPDTKNKRRALIDRLLERDEFADYWAMKWGDILRIKAEFPVNLWPNAAQAYHRWVRASIAENKPYDKFVREMLTSSGSNFRVGPVNFYRAIQNRTPEGIAAAVALTFMGSRAESWPKDRLPGMAVFFSQIGYKPTREWKEEHVFWDPLRFQRRWPANSAPGQAAATATAVASGDRAAGRQRAANGGLSGWNQDQVAAGPRSAGGLRRLADYAEESLVHAEHREPRLGLAAGARHHPRAGRHPRRQPAEQSRAAGLPGEGTGRGPLRSEAPLPVDPELQHVSVFLHAPVQRLPQAEANFASYPLRRLDAEVLIDAINKITGTSDLYTSPIPEPFTYIPAGQAGDCDRRRQHHQSLPGLVRAFGAGHRHGERAQQQARPRPVAAHAEFEPHPAQAGTRPQAQGDLRFRPQAGRDRGGALPDDSFALPDGRRGEESRRQYGSVQPRRAKPGKSGKPGKPAR